MNKKKLLIIIFSVIFSGLLFSETKDEEKFRSYIESSRGFNLSKKREENLTYLCSGKLSENSYFSSYVYNFRYQSCVMTYLTDGKLIDTFYSHELNGIPNNKLKQQIRYLVETKATSLFADFDYDESLEILTYNFANGILDYVIREFFTYDERGFSQEILRHTSWKGYMPRLSPENDYLRLVRDFAYRVQFCIIQQKRGILLKKYSRDESYIESLEYNFYYWSPSEQRFILDESVTQELTQEQLENVYCPDDYFAYNGLKFSKLDSKLTAEDLQDLDKAQLRLMRNAVYARHGRTFKSVDLQSLWNCYTWYKVNPNYSDELLTDIDKYNIKLIQQYEAQR